jgi:hypothetical protein
MSHNIAMLVIIGGLVFIVIATGPKVRGLKNRPRLCVFKGDKNS